MFGYGIPKLVDDVKGSSAIEEEEKVGDWRSKIEAYDQVSDTRPHIRARAPHRDGVQADGEDQVWGVEVGVW